ncbi:FtsK/SpoIIIE domain-containing protein, partial [Staphylococcus argenteus]
VEIISETEIHIENLVGQTDKLEKFKNTLSALLDSGLVCETFELDMTQRFFIATMVDLSLENQRVIKNHDDFLDYIEDTSAYQLRIMPNFVKDISEAPHLLIAGETGSGKSYFLFFIIFQLVMKKVDIFIVDRKKSITKFKTIIGKENAASEIESIIDLIDKVYREMKRRETILEEEYPEMIDVDFTDVHFNPCFLIIDELGSLIAELDSKQKKRVNELLQTIAQRGRATGVNIIIAMQHPSYDNLPTSIRGQLTFKTILGNTDDTTRHLIFRADDMSDIAFEVGQGFFTNSGTHNKLSILFVPTFEFKLDIENLKQLIELNSSRNEHKKNEST